MPVYKDECIYCFDSVESPEGIDVCLTCHVATSPAQGFTQLHFDQTGHHAFVNLTKTPRERPKKQIKLAIDSETDKDLWDLHTRVKDLKDPNVDEEKYKDEIDRILKADSYNKTQDIIAWELEIAECNHTKSLTQDAPRKLAEESLAHCSQCELSNNLWLCLTCGTLSCGRPQFGGGGGNGHALDHYSSTQHPIAVKLGSITPTGSADVFCYAHDEEVKDPKLAEHLKNWGIDVASREKTEKSLTELQLEQNAKWDFSMQSSEGEELAPIMGPGLTGLRNLGNTCYMNSVVQVLFAIPEFRDLFTANTVDSVKGIKDPPNDLIVQLNKLKDGLCSGNYAIQDPHSEQGHQRGLLPAMVKYLVGRNHPEFSTMRQQDAFEFLSHFLTKITEAFKSNAAADPVAALFGFQTSRRIQCQVCGAVKFKDEAQENLSIQVPIEKTHDGFKPVTLEELLRVEFSPESVDIECTICRRKREAITELGFKTFPDNLVLNVRRFQIVNWVPQKVDVPLLIPTEDVDLEPYRSKGPQPDEIVMPEDSEPEFVPDETILEQLTSMGFPREDCIEALENTGNGSAEAAMNWLLLPAEERPKKAKSSKTQADPESVATLQGMGFEEIQALAALKVNNNNVEAAVNWLFEGNAENAAQYLQDDDGDKSQDIGSATVTPKYRLTGIICHKGTSTQTGHYVAFVRRDHKWYLFNDEKVVEATNVDELHKFGYIYVFERIRD